MIRDGGYLEEATSNWIYRVQFGNATRGVSASELEPLPEDANPWSDIRQGSFSGWKSFQNVLTFERLRRPPAQIAASFGSAKAAFYPFQFKPLLKFVENPRKRLLIADDVGLGKTIEAGYIIRELKARFNIERILIVVPSRLRTKWKGEMERRFGERFEIVNGRRIASLRNQLERIGEIEGFEWIVSMESARSPEVIDFLQENQPPLDIVVVDEAHRMRNSGTKQHSLGKALSQCAENMVFLTATPIQTALDNLFQLLNILDDSEFRNAAIFEQQCAANLPIIRAVNAIRRKPADVQTAVESLDELRQNRLTQSLTETDYFLNLVERCRKVEDLDRTSRVALQRDINELSLTGGIVSRTRKVDVIKDRTIRQAMVREIAFTEAERSFYDSVADIFRVIRPDLSGWGRVLALQQVFRATASCIPAAANGFREKLQHGKTIFDSIFRDFDDDLYENGDSPLPRFDLIQEKLDAVELALERLPEEDSKYDCLKNALKEIWEEDRNANRVPRKVVLFAFFKPTLAYLSERLEQDGIDTRLINGDVSMDMRETYIEEFASKPEIRVLLSSEVGSEGVDLQFASVVVNYDLPWNPMVVEQRIGRIDRIGQAMERIIILSLVASDTIEDRILYRLYQRIGLFTETIGELEPILGSSVERLAIEAIQANLTDEQAARRIEESIDATLNERQSAKHLTDEADTFMAADQSFLDEIENLIGRRKVPSSNELHAYISNYLESNFFGSRFPKKLISDVSVVHLPKDVGDLVREALPHDSEAMVFSRLVQRGQLTATLDQDVALKHASAELIHTRHPLVRTIMMRDEVNRESFPRSFALRVNSDYLPDLLDGLTGEYLFEIHLFLISGVRAHVMLVPLFIGTNNVTLADELSENLLLAMLDSAASIDPVPTLSEEIVNQVQLQLEEQLSLRRSRISQTESTLNTVRSNRLKSTLGAALDHRVTVAEKRLEKLHVTKAANFAIRMAKEKLKLRQTERIEELANLNDTSTPIVENELIAAGIVVVERADSSIG